MSSLYVILMFSMSPSTTKTSPKPKFTINPASSVTLRFFSSAILWAFLIKPEINPCGVWHLSKFFLFGIF